ncbi:heavy metal translocating P-type ATPase [Streptomyces sp. NBC_01012]|uniref:heavy metal translocating P-type ATPase n=1 Tax=Streptomyces sp. NBC_01012 TaxID=2903717 RepID=UPI0038679B70|nr:heavy metal translocating P-type ATPase [Streptomyces sp. NBC_01012]
MSRETPPRTLATTDLLVGGMTCAACVRRVEKKLGALEGVRATVNLATGIARVEHPADLGAGTLVAAVERGGYTARPRLPLPPASGEDREAEAAAATESGVTQRLLVTAFLALPVLVLSMAPSLQFRNWQWLCFVLASPVACWSAWPFHERAWRGMRHGAATMDTLVSLGVLASFGWSSYALFLGGAGAPGMRMPFTLLPTASDGTAHLYLESAVGVPLFLLLGRHLEARARRGTSAAVRALAELGVKEVTVREGATERTVPAVRLAVGQVFLVRPGERVATDGEVVQGTSAVDLSLVTGETRPVEVGAGSAVTGGSVNAGGLLLVRATAVGADTRLARIRALVTEAQAGKARAQRLADTVAGVFVPVVLALAVTVLGFWLGADADPQPAFTACVAVLVVACPCALGLATPTALMAATGRGAQLGILIKGPQALEALRQIDTVVLDKTGTLTSGHLTVAALTTRAEGLDAQEVLRLAATVETGSEHPLGRALVRHAERSLGKGGEGREGGEGGESREDALRPGALCGFVATPGNGVRGHVDGRLVEVGVPDGELPEELRAALTASRQAAHTPVLVRVDGRPEAVLALGDVLRPGSYHAVDRLRRLGVCPVLATGDQEESARAVATALGIDRTYSRCTPERKAELVRTLRAEGKRVAVVGDGVNDAAALAGADLGIAMGTGTDVAIGAADVTLVRDDIEAIADAVRLARRTLATIRGNLLWAFGYNAVTLPLAMVGLLNPMLAAAAMSLSSVLVVLGSLRLRSWQPAPAAATARRRHPSSRAAF